ncbi:MAG: hypothetical protein R3313_00910 [Candidatus Saccharimonadales bacterium]|nr:hypothetical protein [Candidatus Saccharimonadales bacterium]
MKLNNRGFGVIEIVLIVVLVGAVGFTLWQINKTDETVSDSETSTQLVETVNQAGDTNNNITKVVDGAVYYLDDSELISLIYEEDVSKLPEGTPQGFIDLVVKEVLSENDPADDCVSELKISRISPVNVAGSLGGANPDDLTDTRTCIGGGKAVYGMSDSGDWMRLVPGEPPLCSDIEEANIYYDFESACFDNGIQSNPNGFYGSEEAFNTWYDSYYR